MAGFTDRKRFNFKSLHYDWRAVNATEAVCDLALMPLGFYTTMKPSHTPTRLLIVFHWRFFFMQIHFHLLLCKDLNLWILQKGVEHISEMKKHAWGTCYKCTARFCVKSQFLIPYLFCTISCIFSHANHLHIPVSWFFFFFLFQN